MKSRFKIIEQIGEGSFNFLYSAYDYIKCEYIALKIEKSNLKYSLLKKEYEILQDLKDILTVPKTYDYINDFSLFISTEKFKNINIKECI